jgi:nitroreductase
MTFPNKPANAIAPLTELIQSRWSPRIFDAGHTLGADQIASLGEAVRWAPSSMNQQPWHVVFLTRESDLFSEISQHGLTGFNQAWAPACSVYAVILGRKTQGDAQRNQAATYYDVGLASMQLVLQAQSMGLHSHFMGGIIAPEIERILKVTNHWVVCVVGIGKQASTEGAEQELIDRETAPRTRLEPEDVYSINSPIS